MRITDCVLTLFGADDSPSGEGSIGATRLGLLTLSTDEGLSGQAMLGAPGNGADTEARALIRSLKPLLIGADPLAREALNARLWARVRQSSVRAIGAIDVALWDLAGKALGQPVHRLIGTCHESVRAVTRVVAPDDIAALDDDVASAREAGWAALTLQAHGDVTAVAAACEAARRAAGEPMPLRFDGQGANDYRSALRLGTVLERLGFDAYEAPVGESDLYHHAKLREALRLPIFMSGRVPADPASCTAWLLARATDALRADVALRGGITATLKVAHLAQAFGMSVEWQEGGNALNDFANLHCALALSNGGWLALPRVAPGHAAGVVEGLSIDPQGQVRASELPGLGAIIDDDWIRAKTVAVVR